MSHPECSNVMLLTCKPSRFACAQAQAVRLFVCPEGFFSQSSSSQQQIPSNRMTAGFICHV